MATMFGKLTAVFGIPSQIKPIVGLPEGRARLRLRNDEFAMVFVRTSTGIRKFYISDVGGNWIAEIELGENRTIQRSPTEAYDMNGLLVACILSETKKQNDLIPS